MEKYWIVGLGNTYKIATSESFLWAPNFTKAGKKNAGYENMEVAQIGDLVFSCVDQHIKDIGIVVQKSYPMQTPSYHAFDKWADMNGRAIKVDWYTPKKGIFLKDYISSIKKISSYPSPFAESALDTLRLKQQYLIEISNEYANFLFNKLSVENGINDIKLELNKLLLNKVAQEDTRQIPEHTSKNALVKVRTAQLLFSKNLSKIEKGCRVTNTLYDFSKVRDRYLISSHIKPWSECTKEQRVDGNNGLFLAPHIDYLFDRYLISFKKDGTMLISEIIKNDAIFEKWNIIEKNVGNFSNEQDYYLEYHRQQFFKKQQN